MSTLGAGPRGSRPRAENDIYSALMLVAFLFMLAATVYLGYRATALFGSLLPPGGS